MTEKTDLEAALRKVMFDSAVGYLADETQDAIAAALKPTSATAPTPCTRPSGVYQECCTTLESKVTP